MGQSYSRLRQRQAFLKGGFHSVQEDALRCTEDALDDIWVWPLHQDSVNRLLGLYLLDALFHFLDLLGEGIIELSGTLEDDVGADLENMAGSAP